MGEFVQEHIKVRLLPEGSGRWGYLLGSHGRVLELELDEAEEEFAAGATAELETEGAVLLGIVERRDNRRLWVCVEHRLDRPTLEAVRKAWREPAEAAAQRQRV